MPDNDALTRRPARSGAARWSSTSPSGSRSYRSAFRFIGIPIIAVSAVFLYRGLTPHLFLPDCDSDTAKKTLSEVLKQLKLEPVRYAPIKTVSTSKTEVVCSAAMPLPDGGNVVADYTFYWQGSNASMRYSVHRATAKSSSLDRPRAAL